jgi:protein-S-isoprenylcysteine O-methyltransferase Ste14
MGLWVPAALMACMGIALHASAMVALGWRRACNRTTAAPDPALPTLVLRGPFRLVRHPQALGTLLLAAAAGLGAGRASVWLVAVAFVSLVIALARRQDHACAAQFGAAYDRYRRAVPFLLPRLW